MRLPETERRTAGKAQPATSRRRGPVREGARLAGGGGAGGRARPHGGKAAARQQAFLERRGLVDGRGGRRRSASPLSSASGSPSRASRTRPSYPEALRARRSLPGPGPEGTAPTWQFLGPSLIPKGQTYGSGPGSSPAVAGRVPAIGVDPSDSDHLLVGSAGGGIWESRDQGKTWAPRTDDQPMLGIGALAFDPTDATKVVAGLGEGNSLEIPSLGLLRSTDGGTTWSLGAEDVFRGSFFYRLVVDAADGNRILAATFTDVFLSEDGGASWTRTKATPTWDVSMNPSGGGPSGEVLAATADGLYRSGNGGKTWTGVGLPGAPSSFRGDVGRIAVAHAPSNGDVAYVFGALGNRAWLWRRTAAGGTFSKVPLPSLDPPGTAPQDRGYGISQSWYDWCLAVAPDDPDTIFLGAVEAFRGHRASSGTWTWSELSSRANRDSIHPDQHTLVFDPSDPQVLYAGNDGGLFRSPDQGDSWVSLNPGLAVTEFEYLAQHPTEADWIIGGTQDNGTLRHREAQTWDQVGLGDGGDCALNDSSPETCYRSYVFMAAFRSRSAGDAGSWQNITPNLPPDYESLFYAPMEVDWTTVVRAGTSVVISEDEGDSWQEVALPATAQALGSAMTFATPSRLLVGRKKDGGIFRIDRNANGWGPAQPLATPRAGYVSDLAADPSTADRYWATYSDIGGGHVYLSTDGGGTWTDVTANLPDIPVNAIEVDPTDPDTAWVGTDLGVFGTTSAGGSWSLFGQGLPNALAVDLVFQASRRVLRVGTRSRGVWEVAVP